MPTQPNESGTADRVRRDLSLAIGVLVGLVFMAGGVYGEYVVLSTKPIDHLLVWTFLAVTVLGALMLPSIFAMLWPRVQQILIFVFPNGIPVIGGKRAGDPPALPAPPAPPAQAPPSDEPPKVPFPPPGFGGPGGAG